MADFHRFATAASASPSGNILFSSSVVRFLECTSRGFAFFGMFAGTEENPEFIQSVNKKLGKDAKIIVACSTGGTLKPTQNLPDGKQSRGRSREVATAGEEWQRPEATAENIWPGAACVQRDCKAQD
ncbi:hypothetical protein ABZP36_020490 [Zizania latifolia]